MHADGILTALAGSLTPFDPWPQAVAVLASIRPVHDKSHAPDPGVHQPSHLQSSGIRQRS